MITTKFHPPKGYIVIDPVDSLKPIILKRLNLIKEKQ